MNNKGKQKVAAAVIAVAGLSLAFFVADTGDKRRIEPDVSVTATVTTGERYVSTGEIADSISIEYETKVAEEYASSSTDSTKTLVTISPEDLIYDHDEEVAAVIALVNEKRAAQGLSALVADETLMMVANTRAKEISGYFSHVRPDGTSCFTALDASKCKYWCAGENIAYGQRHADWVMGDWMNSQSHRDNILYADYGKIGVGLYEGSDGVLYWVQIFTN